MANQGLIDTLKKISVDAVQAGNPTSVVYGTVINKKPLKIQINSKLILDESFLILTKNVLDYKVKFTMDFKGEEAGSITINGTTNTLNKIKYKKGYALVKNGLKKGDIAVMVQVQGGQKYVVVDKMNNDYEDDEEEGE